MKLYIDTSDSEKIVIKLDSKKVVSPAKKQRAQKLLSLIDQTLKGKGSSIDQISQIEVNTGPGSFTGLRVGISVANALGFALGVPVNGRDVAKAGPVSPKYKR